jgi:hypothetical protein
MIRPGSAFLHNGQMPPLRVWLAAISLILPMSSSASSAKVPFASLDPDYVPALAVADRFLQSWQANDTESGIALLTAHAKKNENKDDLENFFAPSEPVAYEIDRGKRVKRGRYQFPVVLVTGASKKLRRKFSSIVVVNTGGNDWAVDKLP